MTKNVYFKGSLVQVKGVFFDTTNQVNADPAVVKCRYIDPDGTATVLTYGVDGALVKDSVGNYHVNINANKAGDWHYRFESTGSGQASNEGSFYIEGGSF